MGAEILAASDRLLAAVLNGIYQGVLITVLVALSFRAFNRVNAATRHAVWLCTLALLVLLVAAHCFFQSPPAALPPGKIARTAATTGQEIGTTDAAALAVTTEGMPLETGSSGPERPDDVSAEQEPPAGPKPGSLSLTSTELPSAVRNYSLGNSPPADATLRGSEPASPPITAAPPAAAVADARSAWFYTAMRRLENPVSLTLGLESRAARIASVILLGACLVLSAARLFLLLVRLRQIRRLKRQSFPAGENLNELFRGLVSRPGAGRKVELKTLPSLPSSFVLGFLHPVILLPAEPMESADAEQILRHELAHVRRRDDWANLLQHFILAAFPFHPAVWWISRRLSLEREIACDDYVLQSSAQPHAYALLLANLASRMQRCPPLLAPGASNNKTQLQQRIDMILDTRRNTSPRLAARWLTIMASATALFAVAAVCLAPRIVLAQSEATPGAANIPGSLIDAPVQGTPAAAFAAAGLSSAAGQAASADEALPATPRPPATGPGPKLKTGRSSAFNGQPADIPAPPAPAVAALPSLPVSSSAPAALAEPPSPRTAQGLFIAGAAPAPEPRPGRTPWTARTESGDSSLEARLERLEKMVESLMARGDATPHPHPMKPSADMVGPVDRKEIAEIEAHARHLAEMERKHGMDAREMERIKEQAKREAARAADLAKPAAVDAEKAARADQKRRTNRNFNKGSQKQLDELRRQLEILEREREKLGRQIEQLERQQEQLDEQRDEDQGNDAQEEPSNFNPESVKGLRK